MPTVDAISLNDVRNLIREVTPPCVSLFMPTFRLEEETPQNRIRLKNLLDEAARRLERDWQVRSPLIRELLEPARRLEDDAQFWREQSTGVALFRSKRSFNVWRLPAAFPEWVWVGERFTIKPLVSLVAADPQYFVLAVSQNQARLYKGSHRELWELEVASLPANLKQALNYQQPEGSFQFHSGQPALPGKEGLVYHSQAGGVDEAKEELTAYFRSIDRALVPYLKAQEPPLPLVFCGVGSLFPLYREVNSYPQLVDRPVEGNPDHWTHAELMARISPAVAPLGKQEYERDARRLQELLGSDRASADIEHLVPASHAGSVEALFVASDVPVWGRYDPRRDAIELLTEPGGEDLLDRAAAETLLRGGRVHAVPARELPAGLVAAAVFRYPVAPLAAR
jgi:hypothetical protein